MAENYENLSPHAAALLIQSGGCHLFDVRTPPEFLRHRIAGATLLPVQELQQRHAEIPRDSIDKKVLIYCEHGVRSAGTCELLAEHGWKNLVNMTGGMAEWVEAGLPYESGAQVAGGAASGLA